MCLIAHDYCNSAKLVSHFFCRYFFRGMNLACDPLCFSLTFLPQAASFFAKFVYHSLHNIFYSDLPISPYLLYLPGATGQALKEAQNINKSLSALGDVIAARASKQVLTQIIDRFSACPAKRKLRKLCNNKKVVMIYNMR